MIALTCFFRLLKFGKNSHVRDSSSTVGCFKKHHDECYIVSIGHCVSTQRGVMVAVNSSRDLSSVVGDFLRSLNLTASNRPHVSRPFHDTTGRGRSSRACNGDKRFSLQYTPVLSHFLLGYLTLFVRAHTKGRCYPLSYFYDLQTKDFTSRCILTTFWRMSVAFC